MNGMYAMICRNAEVVTQFLTLLVSHWVSASVLCSAFNWWDAAHYWVILVCRITTVVLIHRTVSLCVGVEGPVVALQLAPLMATIPVPHTLRPHIGAAILMVNMRWETARSIKFADICGQHWHWHCTDISARNANSLHFCGRTQKSQTEDRVSYWLNRKLESQPLEYSYCGTRLDLFR